MNTSGRSGVVWWGLASAVGMLLGAFTPWVTAFGISFSGTDFPHSDGWILVALAVLGGLCVLGAGSRPGLAIVTLLAGLAAAGITLYDREHLAAAINHSGDLGKALVHVGWGLNLAVLASISLIVQGIVSAFHTDAPQRSSAFVVPVQPRPSPYGREPTAVTAVPYAEATPVGAVTTYSTAPFVDDTSVTASGGDTITIQLWQLLAAVAVVCVALGGGGVYLLTRGHTPAPAPPSQAAVEKSAQAALNGFAAAELDATAKDDVRSAIPAAESYYQSNTFRPDSYSGLTIAELIAQAPGVSQQVRAVVLNHGQGYCLDEQQPGGHRFYYVGGMPGATALQVGVISPGSCPR